MGSMNEIDGMLAEFQSIILSEEASVDDKKTAAEGYRILNQQKLEIQKADQDAEFRESEMVLKESQAELEKQKFDEELAKNEREAKIRRLEAGVKSLETIGKFGLGSAALIAYQLNFKDLVLNESTIHIIPQRPFAYLNTLQRFALTGVSSLLR